MIVRNISSCYSSGSISSGKVAYTTRFGRNDSRSNMVLAGKKREVTRWKSTWKAASKPTLSSSPVAKPVMPVGAETSHRACKVAEASSSSSGTRNIHSHGAEKSFVPLTALRRLWGGYCNLLQKQPIATKASSAAFIFFASDLATQSMVHDYQTASKNHVQEGETVHDPRSSNSRKRHWWQLDGNSVEYDYSRAASGAAFGAFGATYLHLWWGYLERIVALRYPVAQHKLRNTLIKVAIDQGLSAPIYYYLYYVITYVFQSIVRQGLISPSETASQIKTKRSDDQKSSSLTNFDVLVLLSEAHRRSSEMIWPTMTRHWKLWPAVHTVNFYYVPLQHRVLVQNLVLVGWSGYLSHLNHGGLETVTTEIECDKKDRGDVLPATLIRRSSGISVNEQGAVAALTEVPLVTSKSKMST